MLSINQLKKLKAKREFINVKDFIDKRDNTIIVSYKGTGKSTSAMKWCIEEWEKDNETTGIRNTKEELETSDVMGSFKRLLYDLNLHEKYEVKPNGVYKIKNGIKVKVCMFIYMSRASNVSSQNALNKITLIVYDEFINPSFALKNMFYQLFTLYNTLKRTNKTRLLLLGNKHCTDNDIISELGMDFDGEDTTDQTDETELTAAYWLGDGGNPKGMDESRKNDLLGAQHSPVLKRFIGGGASSIENKQVFSWEKYKIKNSFKEKYIIDYVDCSMCIGIGTPPKGGECWYLKTVDGTEGFVCKRYCTQGCDNTQYNEFLDKSRLTLFEPLLNAYKRGLVNYSDCFVKDAFKGFLHIYSSVIGVEHIIHGK